MSDEHSDRRKDLFPITHTIETEISSQKEVISHYKEQNGVADAIRLGEYVRLVIKDIDACCMGPINEPPISGWYIVETNWEQQALILAPLPTDR